MLNTLWDLSNLIFFPSLWEDPERLHHPKSSEYYALLLLCTLLLQFYVPINNYIVFYSKYIYHTWSVLVLMNIKVTSSVPSSAVNINQWASVGQIN